jgi:hypothetical protein
MIRAIVALTFLTADMPAQRWHEATPKARAAWVARTVQIVQSPLTPLELAPKLRDCLDATVGAYPALSLGMLTALCVGRQN